MMMAWKLGPALACGKSIALFLFIRYYSSIKQAMSSFSNQLSKHHLLLSIVLLLSKR
jgi:hypothetical protein